ncbi:MAG: hypothetical protein KKI09_07020 [Spirochaetes bacterium]|nr:hypothetical protein [Spirochaetota bacterium]MBU0955161.1 hypothetical protein [Spirochaetota bacterium]
MNVKSKLFIASAIYLIYTGTIALSNQLMKMSLINGSEVYQALSGVLFGFIGIPFFGIILPFFLARKWKLEYSFWPQTKKTSQVLLVFALFLFVVNFESIKALSGSSIGIPAFVIHFVSILLFHTTYYPLFAVLLLPVLRLTFSTKTSVLITALAFSLYHLAQFHFYPAGLTLAVQLFLFAYYTVSLLLYLWSESLILVALAHQVTGAVSVALNGSLHDDIDFLFYLTCVIISLYFTYMIVQSFRRRNAINKSWWISLKRF